MPTLDQEADLILSRLSKDGIDIPENGQGSMNLKISSQEKETVKNWGKSNLDPNANYYILSPGAMASVKQWDIANYIGLARRLYDEHNLLPLINGIKADHALAEQICNKIPEAVNACGLFSIRETVAVMAEGKFYLGNDGGGMHMAVCAGLKCVAIFSARDFPGKWYPYGNGHFVHRSTVPCEGCWLDDCIEQKNVCLKNIEINDVFQSCIKLI
ncbi:MAG: glycosyltransferase family 9 protein [Lentisphaeria bacterium]|nr:glycosyltransferase family 9 protein [Lentisphaeria bacterium]